MIELKQRDAAVRPHVRWLMLVVFCLITFFANRGALPTDIMESRNIVTAREMVSDGNWLIPTMNGELRLEKPPLPTWVAGVVEEFFPDSLSAQRAAAGLMGSLWTLYLFLLIRYISRRSDLAEATVLVFITCYNLVLMGRSATWDIYCHAFMMGGIYYLTRALYCDRRRSLLFFALAGVFMGLSFLSKGPVSFYALLLPYIIALVVVPRPSLRGRWGGVALMVALMFVVGGWWYVYLIMLHPVEAQSVFHKESGAWSNHNVRPVWYYWRFFLEMGAWSVLMLASLAIPYWRRHITVKRDYLIAITWAVASIVLLSLMPEKKTRYLLPSLAPCSYAVACLIVHFKEGRRLDAFSRWLFKVNGWFLAVVVAALPVVVYFFGVRRGTIDMADEMLVSVVLLIIAVWLAWSTTWNRPVAMASGIAVLFAFVEIFLLGAVGAAFTNPDARSINAVCSDKRVNTLPFYHPAKESIRIELVYEAERKILPLDIDDSVAVARALPCALVTKRWAREELPAWLLQRVDTVAVGTYDDNKHPKSDRHYTSDFINHVTILKRK